MVSTRSTTQERVATRKLVWVRPLTIVLVALVNLVVRTLAVSFFGVASSFVYLQAPFVIGSTVIFLVLALLAFVLVGRVSYHAVRVFRIVAGVALLVSFGNPIMLLAGLFPAVGMNLPIFWTMIVMNCLSAPSPSSGFQHSPSSARINRCGLCTSRNTQERMLPHEASDKRLPDRQ